MNIDAIKSTVAKAYEVRESDEKFPMSQIQFGFSLKEMVVRIPIGSFSEARGEMFKLICHVIGSLEPLLRNQPDKILELLDSASVGQNENEIGRVKSGFVTGSINVETDGSVSSRAISVTECFFKIRID